MSKVIDGHRKKFKHLTISMFIGLLCLLSLLTIGSNVFVAFFWGQTVQGEIVDLRVERNRPEFFNASDITTERHDILVKYSAEDTEFYVIANAHLYSKFDMVQIGDSLILALEDESPDKAHIISYGLFNPIAPLLFSLFISILVLVTPQWLYHYSKLKEH